MYSGANTAELFQDGVSLGKKTVEHCMAVYDVVYRDGELRAVEYDRNGNALAILRSTEDEGEIKVTVTAEGLEPVVLSLSASF